MQPPVHSEFLEIEGGRVHYLTAGQGPKVITLHGLGGPAALRALARSRSVSLLAYYDLNVLSLDLPGFGLSELPASIKSLKDYPRWLSQFIDFVGITSPVNLVGNSMGGGISLLFALQFPAKTRRLVIVGSTGLQLSESPVHAEDRQRPEKIVRRMFYDQNVADSYLAQRVLQNSPDETNEFITALERVHPLTPLDLTSELTNLQVPTLIVWGHDDRIIPVAHAYEFARLIPKAKLHIIPDCGHLPQIEKPEESHRIIADFIKA